MRESRACGDLGHRARRWPTPERSASFEEPAGQREHLSRERRSVGEDELG
jgi:hypothetical protein